MVKLQKITRPNGSEVCSVNIPKEIIEEVEWEKGDKIIVKNLKMNNGKVFVVLRKEENGNN